MVLKENNHVVFQETPSTAPSLTYPDQTLLGTVSLELVEACGRLSELLQAIYGGFHVSNREFQNPHGVANKLELLRVALSENSKIFAVQDSEICQCLFHHEFLNFCCAMNFTGF